MGNLIDRIFYRIRSEQEKRAYEALESDPEYQKAKAKRDAALKDAEDLIQSMREEIPSFDATCDRIDKKYDVKSNNISENKLSQDEPDSSTDNELYIFIKTPISLWIGFFLVIGYIIYLVIK